MPHRTRAGAALHRERAVSEASPRAGTSTSHRTGARRDLAPHRDRDLADFAAASDLL